jgi:flagellar hook-associated protein 3 FlgL
MIGRITQMMMTEQTTAGITQALNRLNTTQQEMTSGKRINQPSDDPYGASQAITLSGDLSSLSNYSNNVNDGTAWTTATGASLSNMNDIVQRVRELTVSAANGTNSASSLQADAAEVNQLIDSIKQEGNTQYAGQYIFSGTTSSVAPYAPTTSNAPNDGYLGGTGSVNRTIGPGATVAVNTDMSQLLGNGAVPVSPAVTPDGKLLDVLRNIAADMTSGNTPSLGTTDLSGIDANLNTLYAMQARVGATDNRLTLATSRIASLTISDTQALSNVQDADPISTYTDYSNEQAAYTAALKVGASIVQQSLMDFLK